MEAAKLLLEYLRVLVWPVVVVAFIIGYSVETRGLLTRVTKLASPLVSAEFATGRADRTEAPSMAPDVWFEIKETSLRHADCISRASIAVDKSGFRNIERGRITYGYTDRFVGAIWCGSPEGLVLITVAGPKDQGLESQHSKLVTAFSAAGP
jgi:hypothetical protein